MRTGDDAVLHVTDAGSGPAVVLCHGIAVTEDFWKHTQPALVAAGRRVITFDQRGHGRSSVGTSGFSVERLGLDLAAVIEQVDLGNVTIVGHSMGGIGLLSLLTQQPKLVEARVRHAVLCSTTPCNDRTWSLFGALPGVDGGISLNVPRTVADPLVRALMFGTSPQPPQRFIDDALAMAHLTDPAVIAEAALALTDFDMRDRLGDVTVSTTVICGSDDRVTLPVLSTMLAERLPDPALHWFDGAGHGVPWERIADVVSLISHASRPIDPT